MNAPYHQIDVTIDAFPEGEKSFVEIPFEVGPDVDRIEVSYHYPFGGGGSVIDLGVARNGRMRGWTGSERGHITVEEDRATPGYGAGPLPGSWHVVLGIVKIGPNCKVDVQIRLINKQKQWLVGELHSHSEHSDGGVTVLDAIYRARAARLNFVSITDHNTISQNFIRPDDPDILVIPAMELTSFYGHTNFHGVAKPVEDWRCRSPKDVADKMLEAKANGATIVINHPFQNSDGGRWQSGFDVCFDAYEIWNGNWSVMNEQGLAFWQELLVQGRRIPATGGSDFHLKNRRRHGRPANRLLSKGHSIAAILEAVRAGRNVVCHSPDEAMAKPFGETTPDFGSQVSVGTSVPVEFSGLSVGDEVRVITEKGQIGVQHADAASFVLDHRFEGQFVRFEVWHGKEPKLFTNPFYAE
ncbi:CehA/McbA family metallohydrolase [Rhizobium rhizoryzae]|uniref:CehA/McbA family metallohydrolase n=1 Tax=Rhizobium rhizoryzae TaxID=451876 RepID=UPI00289B522E|nr:CehA/McbA family metallohydrolase [Rhizobium rhizoryzae]